MDNLEIYNRVRKVPENAQRPIEAGRLKGKTDINPMWRIKTLTEQFGMCGIGWKYEITDKRMEQNPESAEIAAFVDINLCVKVGGEWSAAIPGTGGSLFVAQEKGGLHLSDECFKMALTDALSVACKALGIGADVYWEADSSKYSTHKEPPRASRESNPPKDEPPTGYDPAYNQARFLKIMQDKNIPQEAIVTAIQKVTGTGKRATKLTEEEYNAVVRELMHGNP